MMHKAGIPNQWACQELLIWPRNSHDMECPKPQPGHQVIPIAFNGQRLKCTGPAGSVNASAVRAAIQNVSSKYLKKRRLTNFF
jgi:hypothetical protein